MARSILDGFLRELLASREVTAAAAVVGDGRAISCEAAAGCKSREGDGRVTTASLFDLASLTKPVTATLALRLDRDGTLPLTRTVSRSLANSAWGADRSLARRRLGTLLRHRAGLRPWAPLYSLCRGRRNALRYLCQTASLYGALPGTYSDLDFVLWGLLAEHVTGLGLPDLLRRGVVRPLGERGLVPSPAPPAGAVECRLNGSRERQLAAGLGLTLSARRPQPVGRVQDHNAASLGGLAGHAGLFGSVRAVWRLGSEWLRPTVLLSQSAVDSALSGRGAGRRGYVLGWRKNPPQTKTRAGTWFGHTGFTGCGVWFSRLDGRDGEIRVLLAHRRSVAVDMGPWQRRFLALPV